MNRIIRKIAHGNVLFDKIAGKVNSNPVWGRFWERHLGDSAQMAKHPERYIKPLGKEGIPSEKISFFSPPKDVVHRSRKINSDFPPFLFTCDQGLFFCSVDGMKQLISRASYGMEWFGETLVVLTHRDYSLMDGEKLLFIKPGEDGAPTVKEMLFIPDYYVVHSMAIYHDKVYIPLPNQNGLVTFDLSEQHVQVNHLGVKKTFRGLPDYFKYDHHYNTAFADETSVYITAHNSSSRPGGRFSEIHRFDKTSLKNTGSLIKPDEIIKTDGECCHDVFFVNGDMYWCSSMAGLAMKNDEPIAGMQEGFLSRGMDWDGRFLVVGGSGKAGREFRPFTPTRLMVWSYEGGSAKEVALLDFPRTDPDEIKITGIMEVMFLKNTRHISDQRFPNAPAWLVDLLGD